MFIQFESNMNDFSTIRKKKMILDHRYKVGCRKSFKVKIQKKTKNFLFYLKINFYLANAVDI